MYQELEIIGNLGSDPEMRYTPSGIAVCSFNVATTSQRVSKEKTPECPEGWKSSYNGKNWELTTWFKVTAWRNMAENCNQYLAKGKQVMVKGVLKGANSDGTCNPRVWEAKDGTHRASFEVTARLIKFLSSGSGNSDGRAGEPEAPPPGFVEEDEIPF